MFSSIWPSTIGKIPPCNLSPTLWLTEPKLTKTEYAKLSSAIGIWKYLAPLDSTADIIVETPGANSSELPEIKILFKTLNASGLTSGSKPLKTSINETDLSKTSTLISLPVASIVNSAYLSPSFSHALAGVLLLT